MIPLQQGHLGLGVLLPKRKLLVGEADVGANAAGQRVVLQRREPQTSDRVHSRWHVAIRWNLTCLILCGDFGNDLGHGSFKLLDADVLKDDRALGEQPHVRGHLFTLQGREQDGAPVQVALRC